MKTGAMILRGVLAGWLCLLAVVLELPAQDASSPELFQAVERVRQDLEEELGAAIPSLNLYLETSNRVYFVSAPSAEGKGLTTNTIFRFASNTKVFTAAAILNLHQQGKLRIQDRLSDRIPGTVEPYLPETPAWNIPHRERITLEMLLLHAAGVYDVSNDPVPECDGMSYEAYKLSKDPSHTFSAEELVGQAAKHKLSYFEPGKGYHYSNTGYTLLGEIIARVYSLQCGSRKSCSDYFHEVLTGSESPVPLPDIRFPDQACDKRLPEPFSPGHILDKEGLHTLAEGNVSSNVAEGNGYGSFYSLNRFIRTLFQGKNVLRPETVSLMQKSVSAHNPHYALGCFHREPLGYGHDGARMGNISIMVYHPQTDISIVVYMPFWDLREGRDSLFKCQEALFRAAARAIKVLQRSKPPEPSADESASCVSPGEE